MKQAYMNSETQIKTTIHHSIIELKYQAVKQTNLKLD